MKKRKRIAPYDWMARALVVAGVVLEILFHHSWLLAIGICMVVVACAVVIIGRTLEKRQGNASRTS